jgi:alkaline phosphatase
MSVRRLSRPAGVAAALAAAAVSLAPAPLAQQAASAPAPAPAPGITAPAAIKAKNVIFFVGDGMGISTVTATRVFSVGVAGKLQMDKLPFTALSRTYSEDSITADSAPTMTAMITGQNTNAGVIGLDKTTENKDFNHDGDGAPLTTLIELAQAAGKKTGVVSTARITHATPAACYAHINNRDDENAIALQPLPTDATYNTALGAGVDLLVGGGRQFFVPNTVFDEEGSKGSRTDGRDLRAEYQAAGYSYVWEDAGFGALTQADLPALGLLESSHMEWEYDRPLDAGGEPSLTELTTKAIDLLSGDPDGYVLMIESGRIDHAHHAGNAYRALIDTEELDEAIEAAIAAVDLEDTLIVVTADHSHVFNISGYPLRPLSELPYPVASAPAGWATAPHGGLLNVVYDVNTNNGLVGPVGDKNGVPYTVLVYGNGPGYRGVPRVDPLVDTFPGLGGVVPAGPGDPAYLQEAAVPMSSETHSGEEVAIYAIGKGSSALRGTVKNTFTFQLMKRSLGL